jgi:very-short-patch-repair endonuclease
MSISRARELRSNPTVPERAMWRLLHSFRQQGVHFRRQVQIGKYYADFASHHAKLIIEVDGDTHGTDAAIVYDATRNRYFRWRGYRVMRFSNADVMGNAEGVWAVIAGVLAEMPSAPSTPTPDPSPQGGGRRRGTADE